MSNRLPEKREYIDIDLLVPDPANLRKHGKKNIDAIKGSLSFFKQQTPIVIDKDNIVRKGNGTLEAAKLLGWKKIWYTRTELTGAELIAYAIADNRTSELAEWDNDALRDTLKVLHDEEFNFDAIGFDEKDFDALDTDNKNSENEDDFYSTKIDSPIYKPSGEKPKLEETFDVSKYNQLIDEINKSKLSENEKQFLIHAASRHIIFRYKDLAEYYCHTSPEMQDLMEKSALVIIDYKKAVENSFVMMTKELMEIYEDDTV